ncbi:MAG: calcineurin-like phosphoesterase C-terminal domain-containing protein [Alistipes sp.]|nr:calcineurin-like phosphoesterase C-terminal domain-containing protein [Alistipes sp.]
MKRFLTLILALCTICSAEAAYNVKKIKAAKDVTLTGVVYCGDEPLAGVSVSDGVNVTKTDAKGIYTLKSDKRYGHVYISTPSGYAPKFMGDVRLAHWQATTAPATKRERHDFELEKVNDKKFSLLMFSDSHLCNDKKVEDLRYFQELCLPAIKRACARNYGTLTYAINLGDVTWDRFWYETGFDIERVPSYLVEQGFPVPFLCVMGNHDYDPSTQPNDDTDMKGSLRFRKVFGPTHFSMNIGNVHLVLLDNIVYKNEVKADQKRHKGVVGSRNYDLYVDDVQLEWLRQDLASVSKDTPLVVCMHAPLFTRNGDGLQVSGFTDERAEPFVELLKDYESVRIFSGHKHQNISNVHPAYPNITECNLTAIAGDLWKTPNVSGTNIGEDGGDAGFFCCTFDGKEFTKSWHSVEKGEQVPFRTYDINGLRERYATSESLRHLCELHPNQTNYAEAQYENYIYVNCFHWEEGCTLTISENGQKLEVEQVSDSDPRAAEVIFAPARAKSKQMHGKTNELSRCYHMFRAKAASKNADVTVTLTTPYGETFTQTHVRPAEYPLYYTK